MGKAPKEHYFSHDKKELVLVWNFANPLTLKSVLFAFSVGLFFAILMIIQSYDISKTALISLSITSVIIVWSIIKQQFLKSDRLRLALAINAKDLGTGHYLGAYSIPWSNVEKIQCNSAAAVLLPVSHLNFWIYPKEKKHRFISIPKLNSNEYQEFFEILQWHTTQNNIELIVI